MPALSNTRHERFAQELAAGKPAVEAYREAGYGGKWAEKNAHRLTENDGIKARIAELQERAAQRTDITIERISEMMMEDREFARKNGQAGPAGQCTERLAKLHGLWTEKHEVEQHTTVSAEPVEASQEEWESEFSREH